MQGDAGALHTACIELGKNAFVKMQRGRRRCDCAWVFCKHGLVTRFVVLRIGVCDVGRQWHMAMLRHQRVGVAAEFEAVQRPCFVRPAAQQRRGEAAVHGHHSARAGLFADFHVRGYFMAGFGMRRQHALDQQLQPAAAGFLAKQPGFHNLGVVKHQQVAWQQQAGQIDEVTVDGCSAAAIKQARCAALGRGVLGYEFRRECEIKVTEVEMRLHEGTIVPCRLLVFRL